LEVRRFIRARPQAVWDVLADFESQTRWMVDLYCLEVTSDRKSGEGTVLELTSALFGLPFIHDVIEVSCWQPPQRLEVVHSGAFTGWGSFTVDETPGGCVFTWVEDFKPPFGALGELCFTFVVSPHLRRVFGRSMENVRRLAQGSAVRYRTAAAV
jgi:hypothetical protein